MKNLILLMSVLLLGSVSNMAFAGQTKYQWSGYSTMLGGSCYKVDVATGGDRFKERARVSDCRPSERYIDYVTERGSCYEVDARSTDNYSKEVDSEKCGSFATVFKWEGYSSMLGGSCYEVDVETRGEQFKERTKDRHCRPYFERDIKYVTEGGSCYEVDARSTDNYSKEVDSEKCGSFATVFKWEGYSSMLGGTCYEVDVETRGEQFKERTKDRHCRPYFERDIKYVTERGSCYEVDARNIDNYSKEVDASHCGY